MVVVSGVVALLGVPGLYGRNLDGVALLGGVLVGAPGMARGRGVLDLCRGVFGLGPGERVGVLDLGG